ncbi:membrane-spanning 4-domains subfamily A member 4A-like isoform X3 [Neofelis nebulosa]|uniref:membrane-spanning 4-domains subfamily A member 4A-like isoform X3 n=1 Tax=Neofelis nebulosa TaxID=61452 RepID=UPI00272D4011|nr:membrane-spanning 4-domains subfamily A member 4A-like isoform X3 [Neofelis nebulosa]
MPRSAARGSRTGHAHASSFSLCWGSPRNECSPFSAAMATMQGMEGTISEAGPGGYQLEQPPVIQSHLWKRMPEKFLKGEPKVLGVVQILIAMTNLSLEIIKMSAILPLSDTHSVSGLDVYIIGRPVMFIISGSLSVVAGIRTTKGLIQTSLGLNIFSSVLAGVGVPLAISSLEDFRAGVSACIFYQRLESCSMAMAILTVVLILPSNPHVAETASPTPFTEI